MKINSLIRDYAGELEDVSESPLKEAEEIFMSLLNIGSRSNLYTSDFTLGAEFKNEIASILENRKKNIPLQYLLSDINFYGLSFTVNEGIFIPRPETEILVDYIVKNFSGRRNIKILEIGTGSGIISICLTKNMPQCKIIATDISPHAISVAYRNAVLNNCQSDILFIRGNLFDFLKEEIYFDLIVSNPPYVGEKDFNFHQKSPYLNKLYLIRVPDN